MKGKIFIIDLNIILKEKKLCIKYPMRGTYDECIRRHIEDKKRIHDRIWKSINFRRNSHSRLSRNKTIVQNVLKCDELHAIKTTNSLRRMLMRKIRVIKYFKSQRTGFYIFKKRKIFRREKDAQFHEDYENKWSERVWQRYWHITREGEKYYEFFDNDPKVKQSRSDRPVKGLRMHPYRQPGLCRPHLFINNQRYSYTSY